MDEPKIGLDRQSREYLRDFLQSKEVMGAKTVVLVTHDADIVTSFSDRCIELHEGRVTFDGPAKAISARQQVAYVIEFPTDHRPPPFPIQGVLANVAANEDGTNELTFAPGAPEAAIQQLLQQALQGVPVQSLHRKVVTGAAPHTKAVRNVG